MRLVTFEDSRGQLRSGVQIGDKTIDLAASDSALPASVRELLAAGPGALKAAGDAASSPKAVVAEPVKLKAPIPDPQKVICVGLNYRDHAEESGLDIPTEPVIFNKFPTAVAGPYDDIVLPKVSQQVDYEAELVIVVGQTAKDVPTENALDFVAGYTVGHDVSARDWQLFKDGKQWLLGKTFDTFAPMGPALVTKDEVPNPHGLGIQMRLNGQTMQDSSTAQMIFHVADLIGYVSQVCTLLPGDVIFTGTPPGVGFARKPPVLLKTGDVCEVEIEGLGVLRNCCV